jgi:hypothetical protein
MKLKSNGSSTPVAPTVRVFIGKTAHPESIAQDMSKPTNDARAASSRDAAWIVFDVVTVCICAPEKRDFRYLGIGKSQFSKKTTFRDLGGVAHAF